jgi:hypothetical protein
MVSHDSIQKSSSVKILLLANSIPVFGVAFLGWNVFDILILYWAESVIIGLFNIIKMFKVGGIRIIGVVLFFVIHFGGFMFAHITVLSALIKIPLNQIVHSIQYLPLLGLLLSHGYSYQTNFIHKKEYEKTNIGTLMFSPYGRIVSMHMVVMLGGFLFIASDTITPLKSIILILIKTFFDITLHIKEHKKAQLIEKLKQQNNTIDHSESSAY